MSSEAMSHMTPKIESSPCRRAAITLLIVGLVGLLSACSETRKPNFVIFLVDMLRPDHLGVYGYSKNTSPNLDRLAQEGIVFENAYSPAPWTLPSTVSLLTGLLPSEHGATHRTLDEVTQQITFPANPDVWLPRKFTIHGYKTAAFHTHQYLRRDVSNIHKAFEEYYYPPDRFTERQDFVHGGAPWTKYMYLDTLYPPCKEWLERNYDQSFLLYIHVLDVHGPYHELHLLQEDRERVRNGLADGSIELQRMKNVDMYAPTDREDPHKSYLYDGHIHWMDAYLQELMETLEDLGVAEDTYVFFTSDHGEEFGEHHDYWGHGRYVYNSQVRVPLVILSHRDVKSSPRRILNHVNTVGLLPTMAELAGIELEEFYGKRGFSRLLDSGEPVKDWRYLSVSETARGDGFDAVMVEPSLKLITNHEHGTRELYDLEEDPWELQPLDPSRWSRTHRAGLRELKALRQALSSSREIQALEGRNLDPEAVEALKALGYLQ